MDELLAANRLPPPGALRHVRLVRGAHAALPSRSSSMTWCGTLPD
ncbi:hypothetical protein SAMN05192589_12155 [Paracidovorax valerianellae]|uniref:Uncharacterized protein n=1 Tax=Paracidovorax valerianellae TaxID=187868 RepID=A0A1G7E2J2_9BURK|nr:hypothetical protein [Paracidovorax valerianellae]SDE57933.1 hypothetical protein SAMN05192589_12155 [Paracidovorax valerianellae]